MEKQETISKLYSIRAALSFISEIKDNGTLFYEERENKLKKDIENRNDYIRYYDEKISECESSIYNKKKEIELIDKEIKNLSLNAKGKDVLVEKDREDFNNLFTKIVWGIIGFAIAFTGFWIMIANRDYTNDASGKVVDIVVFSIISLAIGVACAFGLGYLGSFVINFFYKIFAKQNIKANAKKELEQRQNTRDTEIQKCENTINSLYETIKKYESIRDDYSNQKDVEIKGENDLKIIGESMVLECNAVYNTAKESFSSVLDTRDWKYVDYIIYALETGRADTVKEALLSLDRFIQNQEIVQAINSIGNSIVCSIEKMNFEVKNSIQASSINICHAIEKAQQENSMKLKLISDSINLSLARINNNISEMNYNQELTNALIKKSNLTSEMLLADYIYVNEFRC